ncbi:MAG: Mth938-like domain-containing protein [Cocleimonas sp.]
MKFAEENDNSSYTITAYDSDYIAINGKNFHQSLVLSPQKFIPDWTPQSYSLLEDSHLNEFYELNAEIILLGTGEKQIFPNKEILRRLAKEQIGFEIMDTHAACRTFNILMAEGRNVVAGLFLK